jgi:multisubunit Na+/H+ antiporter MnhC subunit
MARTGDPRLHHRRALVGIVTFGSLSGSMLPFLLKRLGFDPASASAPFVATLVDVTGLVIYFSIAAMILAARCCSVLDRDHGAVQHGHAMLLG